MTHVGTRTKYATMNGASSQNLSCLRSGVDYFRFTGNNNAEELLTTLLRQLNVWCESGVNPQQHARGKRVIHCGDR